MGLSLDSCGIATAFGFATVVTLGEKVEKVKGVVLNKLGGNGGEWGRLVSLLKNSTSR